MRSLRVLGLCGSAFVFSIIFAGCGGSGSKPAPPPPLTITTNSLPQATVNQPYFASLSGSGGTGVYTWGLSSGALPPGLNLSGQTAQITGTPTTLGTFSFTAKVTDAAGNIATANLSIVVEGVLVITCNSCLAGTLTLPTGTPGVPYSATLSVTGGVAPYTWCVIETNGMCDNGSGGALPPGLTITTDASGNGVISGTPTTPGTPGQFTVQASDSEPMAARGSIGLNLTIFGIVSGTLTQATLGEPYTTSIVAGGGQPPYTWSITSGSLPPGLAMVPSTCQGARTSACQITGIPTQAGTFNFGVQVQDGENPPATATATLSITVAPALTDGNLKGSYVFSFNGYKGADNRQVIMAGVFAADGSGNITGGELDVNDGSGETIVNCVASVGTGPQVQTIQAAPNSVYSIEPDGLGTLTLVTGSATYNFHIAIRADGSGNIIQDNTDPNTRGSGVIKVQTSGVTLAQIEGQFALGIIGSDPSGNRYSAVGHYSLDNPNGDLSGPFPLDVNDGGTVSSGTFRGTLSTTVDTLGRGCFANLSFNGQLQFFIYAYYIVSSNELVIISTDPLGSNGANLTLWSTYRQITGANLYNNGALAGAATVVELAGRDTNGAGDVTVGLLVGQGSSGNSCPTLDAATFTYDENQGGTLTQQSSQGMYCVSGSGGGSQGRVTLSNFSGPFGTNPPVLYIVPNAGGYAVGTDSAVSAGYVQKQSGAPFSNTSVGGLYEGGTVLPVASAVTDSVTALLADGAGNINATQDTSGTGGPGQDTLTLTYQVDSTGRAVVQQNGSEYGILYVISPTKVVVLPADAHPALNVLSSAPGS
ncbi:MAG TPA: Ig domain-containing protein [Candidatus Binatia bacterium]|nr:Ig domain-containing protein [Candidatus Binatia bacterium]